jgi:hypothetical protein
LTSRASTNRIATFEEGARNAKEPRALDKCH